MQRTSAIHDALEHIDDPTHPDCVEHLAEVRVARGAELVRRQDPAAPGPVHQASADAFPDADGLPEVPHDQLDLELLASGIQHHGGLVVRGLFDPATVEALRAELDRTERRRAQHAHGPGDHRPAPGPHGLQISPRGLELLLAAYDRAGLTDLVRRYLGDVPVLATNRVRLRRDERARAGRLPWHQDAVFFLHATQAVNVWAALTPVGEDRPGLEVAPARQPGTLGYDEDELAERDRRDERPPLYYAKDLGIDLADAARGGDRAASPVLEPGDAIVFDDLTLHRTGTQRWRADAREVAITWFFHPARFPKKRVQPVAV